LENDVPRLIDLPASLRLAIGCFASLVLGFLLLAQANLAFQVGGGRPATPDEVLVRYHGHPERTRLHEVLDLSRPLSDPRNMSQYLGARPGEPLALERRRQILDWVEAGAPEAGWEAVAPIFTGFQTCGACHAPGGERRDLPFTSYAAMAPVTRPGQGMALARLLRTAHNHLFGFSVLALLLSLGLCLTRVRARLCQGLILAASGGAALNIAGWFLTRAWGSPFHWMVLIGGGLFGLSSTLMALFILRDALASGLPAPAPRTDAQA